MQNITLTKDTVLEEFKIFIERSEGEKSAIQAGNQLLFTLVQSGLIDQFRFANLFGRADADMIAKSMREYQAEKSQAANHQQEMAAKQQQMAGEQMAQEQQMAMERENSIMDRDDANKQMDRDANMDQTIFKEGAKNEREQQKLNQQYG